jgi:hypothetical protein
VAEVQSLSLIDRRTNRLGERGPTVGWRLSSCRGQDGSPRNVANTDLLASRVRLS